MIRLTYADLAARKRQPSLAFAIRSALIFPFLVNHIVACTPVTPKVIEVAKDQTFLPSTPDEVKNNNQAIATVATAATNLGLPKADHLSLWMYPSTESFKYWGGRGRDMGHVADAVAYANGRIST